MKSIKVKISEMSIPCAMLSSALIVGISIFLTTWVFFGGDNNRQKLSIKNPALNKNNQTNQLTPQQIQQMQQQRALQTQQASSTPPKPATTTAPKVIKK